MLNSNAQPDHHSGNFLGAVQPTNWVNDTKPLNASVFSFKSISTMLFLNKVSDKFTKKKLSVSLTQPIKYLLKN